MSYFVHVGRDIRVSPYHNMSIIVRDVLRLEPAGRSMDRAVMVKNERDIPPIPKDIWYFMPYRRSDTGQVRWKRAHAEVANAR
jgi:hypothetical protein